MSPLKKSNNLAARMGRWSASHWKTAVFGWIAFVIVAVVAGGVIGTKQIDQRDANVGQAHRADEILKRAGFQAYPQTEIVIVQNKSRRSTPRPSVLPSRMQSRPIEPFSARFTNLRSPLPAANPAQVSRRRPHRDGRVRHARHRRPPTGAHRSDHGHGGKIAARHPGFFVGEAGSISSGKALNDAFESQLGNAGERSAPLTLPTLLPASGRSSPRGCPLLLALSAVARDARARFDPEPPRPDGPRTSAPVRCSLGSRSASTTRSSTSSATARSGLPGKGAREALEAAAATSGRAVLRLGIDGDGRDGRDALLRRQDLPLVRDRAR